MQIGVFPSFIGREVALYNLIMLTNFVAIFMEWFSHKRVYHKADRDGSGWAVNRESGLEPKETELYVSLSA